MTETRTIEQQLSDLQDRYNVLAAEHEALKAEFRKLTDEHVKTLALLTKVAP